jgi:hypothetical protein
MLVANPEIAFVITNEAADVHILTSTASSRIVDLISSGDGMQALLVLGAEELELQHMWSLSIPWGVLPMDVGSEELIAAVHAVAAGLVVGTPRLLTNSRAMRHELGPLTDREVQILGLLSAGLAN